MEIKKNKELYDAPSMLVFEVKVEGVICQSVESTMPGEFVEVDLEQGLFDF